MAIIIFVGSCQRPDNGSKGKPEKVMDDVWEPLQYFIGYWKGNEDGGPDVGKGEREYRPIIKNKYLHFENMSIFDPTEKKPEGEVHIDWGFFSYDAGREIFILRQFHGEGFVNQYIMQEHSDDYRKMVFVTENIENGPPGMRARLTYTITDENAFHETFDLAMPGKEFVCYIENSWKRQY